MEEIKDNMSELEKLMHKTGKAMEMTRQKQSLIDTLKSDIMEEVRPMMVEKMKEDIKLSEEEKKEFDEMTKNAMIEAKKNILEIRDASEKEYNDKLIQFMQKQKRIEEKLASIKGKELPEEKLEMAEKAAKNALDTAKSEMQDFQKRHFIKRAKLDEFEKNINDWAIELGVEKELANVTRDESKKEEPKEGEPKKGKPKKGEPKKGEPKKGEPKKGEPKKGEPKEGEPKEGEPKKGEPKKEEPKKYDDYKKISSINVVGKTYKVTYEIKENGKYTRETEEFSKLGFFQALKQKMELIKNRKEYGISLRQAMKTDGNIISILDDETLRPEDKKIYLDYLSGNRASCFDINYDKNNRFARALGKGQERLRLKETENLEQYYEEQIIPEDDDKRKQFLAGLQEVKPMSEEEHAKEEAKLNELFKTGKIASEEEKKKVKKSKGGKYASGKTRLFGSKTAIGKVINKIRNSKKENTKTGRNTNVGEER